MTFSWHHLNTIKNKPKNKKTQERIVKRDERRKKNANKIKDPHQIYNKINW